MKVLACDGIHEDGLALFRDAGWEVLVAADPIKDPQVLALALADVDAVLVRSATKVPADALANVPSLKVIGRAGAGVDTIDVEAATAKGIAVMNAPDGNTLAAAEHAISLLFALARHVPRADAGMKAGEWPKAGLTGFELEGKKLGVIGLGRIGGTVARKAQGIGMEVAAHDPFLPANVAGKGSVPLKTLDELLAWADIVTLHIPRTRETTNLLSEERMRSMKKGAYIINAARGGLVDEAALLRLLDEGQIAGAALDTFATEPLQADSPLRRHAKLILTPHLGASTSEAQVNVAIQVAEQMSDFLLLGGVTNAINMPSLSAEEAPRLKPYMALAERLGSLVGQLAHGGLSQISIETEGAAAELNQKPISSAVLAGFMRVHSDTVNMVNAPFLAKERGIDVREIRHEREGDYHTLVRVSVMTQDGEKSVAGTLFGNSAPRLVDLFGVAVEAELDGDMIYIVNEDKPGFIGRVGSALGEAGVNIATFHLGRRAAGDEAIALIAVDGQIDGPLIRQISALPSVKTVMPLRF